MTRQVNLNEMAQEIEQWVLSKGFKSDRTRVWELFALTHTEISEAVDAYKKGQSDEKIGQELTDALIRILHLMHIFKLDIDELYNDRMDFNWQRPRHFNTVRTTDEPD
jgi:NTP pyrophosphatase (non-canonical NTP hydrolase)